MKTGSGPAHPDYHAVLALGGAPPIAIARKGGIIPEEWVVRDIGSVAGSGIGGAGKNLATRRAWLDQRSGETACVPGC